MWIFTDFFTCIAFVTLSARRHRRTRIFWKWSKSLSHEPGKGSLQWKRYLSFSHPGLISAICSLSPFHTWKFISQRNPRRRGGVRSDIELVGKLVGTFCSSTPRWGVLQGRTLWTDSAFGSIKIRFPSVLMMKARNVLWNSRKNS